MLKEFQNIRKTFKLSSVLNFASLNLLTLLLIFRRWIRWRCWVPPPIPHKQSEKQWENSVTKSSYKNSIVQDEEAETVKSHIYELQFTCVAISFLVSLRIKDKLSIAIPGEINSKPSPFNLIKETRRILSIPNQNVIITLLTIDHESS